MTLDPKRLRPKEVVALDAEIIKLTRTKAADFLARENKRATRASGVIQARDALFLAQLVSRLESSL